MCVSIQSSMAVIQKMYHQWQAKTVWARQKKERERERRKEGKKERKKERKPEMTMNNRTPNLTITTPTHMKLAQLKP